MTSVPTGPVASAPEKKTSAAAALFAGFMTLALGGAGLVIAALAVGAERAWNGGATERSRASQRSRGWLAEQRAWLDADHQQRVARAAERQKWLESGGDPATEPAKPSKAKRAGGAIRRLIANLAVGASDFKNGFKDGWKAADETRKNGGGFRDIAGARPGASADPVCVNCQRKGVPVASGGMCADCVQAYERPDTSVEPDEGVVHDTNEYKLAVNKCWECTKCGQVGFDYPTLADAKAAQADHICDPNRANPDDQQRLREAVTRTNGSPQPVDGEHPKGFDAGLRAFTKRPVEWKCDTCGKKETFNFTPPPGVAMRCNECQAASRQFTCPTCGPGVHTNAFNCPADRARWNAAADSAHAGAGKVPVTCVNCGKPVLVDRESAEALTNFRCCTTDPNTDTKETPVGSTLSGSAADNARDLWQNSQKTADQQQKTAAHADRGDAMTQSAPAPAGESNATVLRLKLDTTQQSLQQITDLTDQLAKARAALDSQVRDAGEFAQATGQSSQARQALDEANAVSAAMGQHLGTFSEGAVSAGEQVSQASAGLRVAENAEDSLRASGADGRAVAPAGANA